MIFLVVLGALVAAGVGLACFPRFRILGTVVGVISGFLLAIVLVCAVSQRADQRSWIIEYEAFRKTVTDARAKGSMTEFERAAILKDVADKNGDIMSVRYWNQTTWDIFWLDDFDTLELME